jgi:drug/metabolite transporter (DMT)-like permease
MPGSPARPGDDRLARGGYAQALAAVALFSASPVLVRRAETVSAVEITFWRLAIAAATVVLLAAFTRRPVRWRRLPWRPFAAYGLVIALHFFLYIASLFFTTVAHALALVYTAPLFIAVLSRFFLGERLSPRRWLGVLLAVAGVAILTGFEPRSGPEALLGDLLAVGSAVAFAVYSIIGRAQRDAYPLFDYAAGIYAWGAVWLLPLALWRAPGSEYTLPAALAIVGLGVGPLGAGHTLYNAALRRIPATSANLIATLEVVGGVALSALVLGEVPSPAALAGAGVVLGGIVLVVR